MCGYENKTEDREHEKIKCNNHEIMEWKTIST
jgi:hypothetical protein